jgi:hypothetical protein
MRQSVPIRAMVRSGGIWRQQFENNERTLEGLFRAFGLYFIVTI